mmetsp:Transcript_17545/g.16889  ORF Transcript_17545/g.16889 Transcript_17545/m.16889 type:complete len:111 (+) Transcript_17545:74-406(+)
MSVTKLASKICSFVGLIFVLHAAYSANHYKTLSLVSGLGASLYPPIDVIIECFLALGVIVIGQILPLSFQPVILTADKASKSSEESLGRPDLMTFNHRSKELFMRMNKSK